jgi:hypothetical protein
MPWRHFSVDQDALIEVNGGIAGKKQERTDGT